MSFWIDRGEHINVAAATFHGRNITVGINATNIKNERFGGEIEIVCCKIVM